MYIKKVQSSQNNPEKSYSEKKVRYEPSGWSMSIICSFDKKKINLITIEEKIVLKNSGKKNKRKCK